MKINIELDDEVAQKIQNEASIEGLTTEGKIQSIIRRHTEWDFYARDIGFASLSKPFLRALLESVSDKRLTDIAVSNCRGAFRDAMILVGGKMSVEAFMKVLPPWLYAANVPHSIGKDEDGNYKLVVQHALGKNWAIYFGAVANSILNELGYRVNSHNFDDNMLNFSIVRRQGYGGKPTPAATTRSEASTGTEGA